MKAEIKRVAMFQPEFIEDLSYWVEADRRTAKRLLDLVKAALRDPVKGIGKPEPLKYLGSDVWSRRITQEPPLRLSSEGGSHRVPARSLPLLNGVG